MKIVIQTQHRENYGAHARDGEGECPQRWKYKGGDTYILHDVSIDDARETEYWDRITSGLESRSHGFEEYVISSFLVDEAEFVLSNHVDEWDSPIELIELADVGFTAHRVVKNDGYWSSNDILRKFEKWDIVDGERQDFECSYEFVNGRILPYAEAVDYIEQLKLTA